MIIFGRLLTIDLRLSLVAVLFVGAVMPTMAFQSGQPTITRHESGISLAYQGMATAVDQELALDVITDRIIHVVARPLGSTVRPSASLVIVDSLHRTVGPWQLEETAEHVLLKTTALTAQVTKATGVVTFLDKQGQPLLAERQRDATTFAEAAYDGDAFYRVRQHFTVSDGEGLYGLGQHQNGVMNYRGRQVTLLQYNTMIGVPFLLSTNQYGILWHNYSITKAGDIRPLLPLSAFRLYSKEGQPGWLTATYRDKDHPGTVWASRPESDIAYLYLDDQSRFPDSVDLARSQVTYEGELESPYSGLHRLHFNYSGYVKVWIDGQLQEDRWRESWNAGSFEIPLDMQAGERHAIRLEWLPDGGQSYLGIQWQRPIPASDQALFSFDSEAGAGVDYYFVAGDDMDAVIGGYRHLTGRAPIMPRWAFGYWQSRERYKTQQELEEVAREFRRRRIPIDNLVQDWSYWPEHDWGSHTFDSARFPDPEGMIKRLHGQHFRLMISVWPKINEASSVYPHFRDNGWLYMRNIYDGRRDWIGKGYTSTFYDPFNAGARQGFWTLLDKQLYQKGVDAWWMDASEPDIHSNLNIDERKSVMQPAIGSSARYYNAFPLENARGIYEGQRHTDPENRVFILTRSFFAGQQRYAAAAWSGDISARWHDMKDQIAAGVNFSMSGTPYWTMDAGGFLVERRFHQPNADDLEAWRELNARWYQYGAFLPLFRAHGQFPYREPFHIAPDGHPAYSSMRYYIELRYRLLPYTYSLAGNTYLHHDTMLRGLAMDFPRDTRALDINDQFLFGPSLLVSPVTQPGATSRPLYLPQGAGWYDFYSGEYHRGGQMLEAAAPYERLPLFAKAGSMVPIGPAVQYTDEKPADEITLWVYGGADATFTLYEDEGTNYNYEQGKFSTITFTYYDSTKTLHIGSRKGTFEGMLARRKFHVVYVHPDAPQGVATTFRITKTATYTGKEERIILSK
ncbi:TIM-barrel domain-containing protein [Parapedobacter koreensis]|uniref:Alpha-D-xyloside xylohydrolase n=1 Tax=Parapedobacter koreensis TaxID=332977 RepID=A0A1H7Q3V3_9SPHI|nr:TIM-barrel domain-containing protein [Parapedobacter koreensis]SEL42388.1 alpha-D-xyloside xylohydrolase [Parapedobacter koreensis]